MTATISLLEEIHSQLEKLLLKSAKLKPSGSIEPPLSSSHFSGDKGLPLNDKPIKLQYPAVEIAAKQILQSQLTDDANREFGQIWNLLDIIQILGDQDQCDPTTLWYLIEDLLDTQDIEGCRSVFDYLESRREALVAKSFSKVNLIILRACNELLRRLSKAEDAVFCGRVFVFVFQCFPLGHKSAINRQGDYNSKNITVFDEIDQKIGTDNGHPELGDNHAQMEGIEEEEKEDTMSPDMDQFYCKFWSLQNSFANPPSVCDTPSLEIFKTVFEETLKKFKERKNVLSSTSKSEDRKPVKRTASEVEQDGYANILNPKYLTSRELFDLELSDLSFRRHILVQGLILIQFLLSFTEKAKGQLKTRTQLKLQFALSEEDTKWALEIKRSISNTLRIGSDGLAFARVVDTVLARDKNWVRWKEDNCPEISIAPISPDAFSKAATDVKSNWSWKRLRATPLGSLDLEFLNDVGNGNSVDILPQPERFALPEAKSLVRKVESADLDLDFADTQEQKDSIEEAKLNDIWRTLRLVSKSALSKFDKLEDGSNITVLLSNEHSDEVLERSLDEIVESTPVQEEEISV